MDSRRAYEELIRLTREAALLSSCVDVLGWDEETCLPAAGFEHRAAQLALLTGLHHERLTSPRRADLLDLVAGSDLVREPDGAAAVNVRELRRQLDRLRRLPRSLIEETARVTTLAQQVWADARRARAYEPFQPWLERVVVLKREEAAALGLADAPYDAMLEDYEPGLTSRDITQLYAELRPSLLDLLGRLLSAGRHAPIDLLRGDFPVDRQRTLGETAAAAVGFDFTGGRLDEAAHPSCCSLGPGDCRLTTRYHPHRFGDAFFSTMHEVGHGLYEQGLDPEHQGTPFGEAPSVALHESQARLWENAVARGRPFWRFFFPTARRLFPAALGRVRFDDFVFALRHVAATPVRVQADEVTYNLHILIRFELEQALLTGKLRTADLPGAWADAYRRDLGLTPQDDAEGCLQDGHWAAGLFGYFPTYTLGNLIAAQLFGRARHEVGDLDERMAHGDFGGLLEWLRRRVHRLGGRYSAAEMVEQATGTRPSVEALVRTLREVYGPLYGIG
jgi:carboxypeptidase Taq